MVSWDNNLRIPVIVRTLKERYEITVPDLEMTVWGRDFISATANAVLKCTATYYYNLQHNLPFPEMTPYAKVEEQALKEGKGCFATLLSLSD